MLKKEYRICKRKDYNKIYKNGKKLLGKYLVLFVMPGNEKNSRYGIVASKKVGNAVKRNRAKRLIRRVINNNMDKVKNNTDVVVIARVSINNVQYNEVSNDFICTMRKFFNK